MAHASGHLTMTMSDEDFVTSRAAMATSEKIKGDDDDYQNGKSFEQGLVRVGQPQVGFLEHKGELSYGCAGPPARKSLVTRLPAQTGPVCFFPPAV